MNWRFLSILGVIVIIFTSIIVVNSKKNVVGTVSNHTEGTSSKQVTLLEYGDYECPACGKYYPVVKQVVAGYSTRIVFQFRNLPLTQIHPNAFAGARAAEAASLQGKFWQMHDMLYENQTTWGSASSPTSFFNQYAAELGLNVPQFKTDFASDKVNGTINADLDAFNKTGATLQTPTFFLDGKRIDVNATADSFHKVLDAELAQKN